MNKTQIVCTIGPKTLSKTVLLSMREAGMSIARLNSAHSDFQWHKNAITLIREAVPNIPILLDIPGRKIRTMRLGHEPLLSTGDILILTTDIANDGTKKVPISYPDLHKAVTKGVQIFADDGRLKFRVEKIVGNDIHCRVEISGQLKSRKGINVPDVALNTPLLSENERSWITLANESKVDFVGISFVESAGDIQEIRGLLGGLTRIVAKVENKGGLRNVREIAQCSDFIMIDRGDLSVETGLQDVAIKQKIIISAAKEFDCPVIVATEMLHNMVENPRPAISEVSDITNAILDGCWATMLSAETAIGSFPVESIRIMREVHQAVENSNF